MNYLRKKPMNVLFKSNEEARIEIFQRAVAHGRIRPLNICPAATIRSPPRVDLIRPNTEGLEDLLSVPRREVPAAPHLEAIVLRAYDHTRTGAVQNRVHAGQEIALATASVHGVIAIHEYNEVIVWKRSNPLA